MDEIHLSDVIDGKPTTAWMNFVHIPGSWIELDLGSDRRIDRVVIQGSRHGYGLTSGYILTIAPNGDQKVRTEIARSEANENPIIDTTTDGTWLNVDENGRSVPAVGRYLRLVILSGSEMAYEVILDREEVYRIEDFHYEGEHLALDLKEGILVPGTTSVGVTVVIILGSGTYALTPPKPDELSVLSSEIRKIQKDWWIDQPVSGVFSNLFIRINPQRYEEIFAGSLLGKVKDEEAFAQAKKIYRLFFSSSYHFNEFASIPPPDVFGITFDTSESGKIIRMAEGETFFATEMSEPVETPKCSVIDVLDYDIQAQIQPEHHSLSVKADIGLKVLGEDEGWIGFPLRKSLEIKTITDRTGHPLEHLLVPGLDEKGLFIRTASVPMSGDTLWVGVEYSGEVVTDSTRGRIWDYIGPEGSYVRPEAIWYPRQRGDRATASMAFTVPESVTVVSNGRLDGVLEEGDQRTFQWVVDHPVMGLAFTAARYVRDERAGPGGALQSYLFPQHAGKAKEYLDRCGEILSFYSMKFGPYPYDKFAVVEIPRGYRGGHGDQSFIMMYEEAFRRGFDEKFWAHEIAHQWWGNWVGVNPEYGDWLAEGLAEYSSLLFIEHKYGEEELRTKLQDLSLGYLGSEQTGPYEPLLRNASDPVVAYKKGAYFFHMLRYMAGEERFFAMLRTLMEDYGGKEIDPSVVQGVCETLSGEDLSWFFSQWLDQPGAPEYSLIWECTERPTGGYTLNGTIHQVQGKFRMPLEVMAVDDHESWVWRVWVEGEETPFSFEVESKVKEVLLDPSHWVLRHTPHTRAYAQIMEYMREGTVLWRKGDYQEAKVVTEQALVLQPEGELRGRLLCDLGRVEYKLRESDTAFVHLQDALPLLRQGHWTMAWARNTLGDIYVDRGDYENARQQYEAVIGMQATANSVKHAQEGLAKLLELDREKTGNGY